MVTLIAAHPSRFLNNFLSLTERSHPPEKNECPEEYTSARGFLKNEINAYSSICPLRQNHGYTAVYRQNVHSRLFVEAEP